MSGMADNLPTQLRELASELEFPEMATAEVPTMIDAVILALQAVRASMLQGRGGLHVAPKEPSNA